MFTVIYTIASQKTLDARGLVPAFAGGADQEEVRIERFEHVIDARRRADEIRALGLHRRGSFVTLTR